MYLSIFWYTKSNAKEDKTEMQDFQIPIKYIQERKFALWTNNFSASQYNFKESFHGKVTALHLSLF